MISKYKMHYSGSVFWVVFWAIFWFPIALLYLLIDGRFESPETSYYFEYGGSTFWLAFWLIFGFPIALILLAINGITLCKKDMQTA